MVKENSVRSCIFVLLVTEKVQSQMEAGKTDKILDEVVR